MTVRAGADTAVVVNQPLQFNATGAESYTWYPPLYLNAVNIANPVATFPDPMASMSYKVVGVSAGGCRDSAFVSVRVFKGSPRIFVPTAFTPNSDGRNDLLRPIAAGIKNIEFFNIYNRWGQLVFSTRINGHGWDGRINGMLQNTGTFVWLVKAVDFTGKSYLEKGVFTLIR
jgi:gliding motility-associated-like protein